MVRHQIYRVDIRAERITITTVILRLLLNPSKNIIKILIKPNIYCFWLSIGVMTITAAAGASTSSNR